MTFSSCHYYLSVLRFSLSYESSLSRDEKKDANNFIKKCMFYVTIKCNSYIIIPKFDLSCAVFFIAICNNPCILNSVPGKTKSEFDNLLKANRKCIQVSNPISRVLFYCTVNFLFWVSSLEKNLFTKLLSSCCTIALIIYIHSFNSLIGNAFTTELVKRVDAIQFKYLLVLVSHYNRVW